MQRSSGSPPCSVLWGNIWWLEQHTLLGTKYRTSTCEACAQFITLSLSKQNSLFGFGAAIAAYKANTFNYFLEVGGLVHTQNVQWLLLAMLRGLMEYKVSNLDWLHAGKYATYCTLVPVNSLTFILFLQSPHIILKRILFSCYGERLESNSAHSGALLVLFKDHSSQV